MQALIDSRLGNNTWKFRKPIESTCIICNTVFKAYSKWNKTCSTKCKKEHTNSYMTQRRKDSLVGTLQSVVAGCRSRAKRKGLSVDIDVLYVTALLEKQDGKCAVTKINLESSECNSRKGSNPWTISIDRIDSSKGYTKDNIRLVCLMYNMCKGIWSDEDVITMCKGILS